MNIPADKVYGILAQKYRQKTGMTEFLSMIFMFFFSQALLMAIVAVIIGYFTYRDDPELTFLRSTNVITAIVALTPIISYILGMLTGETVETSEHLENRLKGAVPGSYSGKYAAEEAGAGCLAAVIQFLAGSTYRIVQYVLKPQGMPERDLLIATALMTACLNQSGISRNELIEALKNQEKSFKTGDIQRIMELLGSDGYLAGDTSLTVPDFKADEFRRGDNPR
jgi:hypothetical protein